MTLKTKPTAVSRMLARKGDGLRRGPRAITMGRNPSKESAVAAKRKDVDTSEYSGRVAVRCRKCREQAGLTREQLWQALNKIGVKATVPTIYGWENGSRKIDPDLYPKLAKIFGISLFDFLPPR